MPQVRRFLEVHAPFVSFVGLDEIMVTGFGYSSSVFAMDFAENWV